MPLGPENGLQGQYSLLPEDTNRQNCQLSSLARQAEPLAELTAGHYKQELTDQDLSTACWKPHPVSIYTVPQWLIPADFLSGSLCSEA